MEATLPRTMLRARRQVVVCPISHKQGYRSKRKAQRFAERSAQITGKHIHPYQCRFCGRWHLTSQEKD